jgi:hypothetical protein
MIGEALYHDTTPTREGAHDGRCVKPRQQQPDTPLNFMSESARFGFSPPAAPPPLRNSLFWPKDILGI